MTPSRNKNVIKKKVYGASLREDLKILVNKLYITFGKLY